MCATFLLLFSHSVILVEVQKLGPEDWPGENNFQILPESNCSPGLNPPQVLPAEDIANTNYLPLSSIVVTAIAQRILLRNKYFSAQGRDYGINKVRTAQ